MTFNEFSLISSFVKTFYTLPRQNSYQSVFIRHVKFTNFCFVDIKITLITMVTKLKENFVFALVKLMLIFFSAVPALPLISTVGPSRNTKTLFY